MPNTIILTVVNTPYLLIDGFYSEMYVYSPLFCLQTTRDDMLRSIIVDRWRTCCFALSSSSLSAATAADDDDDADSVIIHRRRHCYRDDDEAARVLKRCASKEGGGNNNQPVRWHCCRMPSMVISAIAWWLLRSFLFCGCGWLSRLRRRVLRLRRGVAVAPWLLRLCHSFQRLRRGCCGCAVVSCGCVVV